MLVVVKHKVTGVVDSFKFDDSELLHVRLKEIGCEADTHEIVYLDDCKRNWDNSMARRIIDKEGIGYAVSEYCGHYCFADPITRTLWKNASEALNALAVHLKIEGA